MEAGVEGAIGDRSVAGSARDAEKELPFLSFLAVSADRERRCARDFRNEGDLDYSR